MLSLRAAFQLRNTPTHTRNQPLLFTLNRWISTPPSNPANADGGNAEQKPSEDNQATKTADDTELLKLKTQLEESEQKHTELKNLYLRSLADQENLRDRTRKEKELAQQLAIKSFAKDLLSISDILDLALTSVKKEDLEAEESPAVKALNNLFTGLKMTRSEMDSVFKRHGLVEIETDKKDFDPNLHEALFQVPKDESKGISKAGIIVNTLKKGYTLNGIVIRAAQVGVSS